MFLFYWRNSLNNNMTLQVTYLATAWILNKSISLSLPQNLLTSFHLPAPALSLSFTVKLLARTIHRHCSQSPSSHFHLNPHNQWNWSCLCHQGLPRSPCCTRSSSYAAHQRYFTRWVTSSLWLPKSTFSCFLSTFLVTPSQYLQSVPRSCSFYLRVLCTGCKHFLVCSPLPSL